jgi:hypothetical protein
MFGAAVTTMAILAAVQSGPPPPDEARRAGPAASAALPANVRASSVLAPAVLQLMAVSPTFLAQMRRVAEAPRLRVSIEPAIRGIGDGCHCSARTVMRRYSGGRLVAIVTIAFPLKFVETAELLGHELEHVIEQLEEVDVRGMAADAAGATRVAEDTFETTRAKRAGEVVAGELERAAEGEPDAMVRGVGQVLGKLRGAVRRFAPVAPAGGVGSPPRR